MAQEFGSVTAARDAVMRLRLTNGEAVECVIDTGFTGALMLPRVYRGGGGTAGNARLRFPPTGFLRK